MATGPQQPRHSSTLPMLPVDGGQTRDVPSDWLRFSGAFAHSTVYDSFPWRESSALPCSLATISRSSEKPNSGF
jgi:hypothetical protein